MQDNYENTIIITVIAFVVIVSIILIVIYTKQQNTTIFNIPIEEYPTNTYTNSTNKQNIEEIEEVPSFYDIHTNQAVRTAQLAKTVFYVLGWLHIIGFIVSVFRFLYFANEHHYKWETIWKLVEKEFTIQIIIISAIATAILAIIDFIMGLYLYYNLTTKAYTLKLTNQSVNTLKDIKKKK